MAENGTNKWRLLSLALIGVLCSGVFAYIARAEMYNFRQDDHLKMLERDHHEDLDAMEKKYDAVMEVLIEMRGNQRTLLERLGATTQAIYPLDNPRNTDARLRNHKGLAKWHMSSPSPNASS
jgi:hypothetical protein